MGADGPGNRTRSEATTGHSDEIRPGTAWAEAQQSQGNAASHGFLTDQDVCLGRRELLGRSRA